MFLDEADPNLVRYPDRAAAWTAIRKRAFDGPVYVRDPWAEKFGGHVAPTEDFHTHPLEILQRARKSLPEDAPPSASAFADWVYSLYRKRPSEAGMARGRAAEILWDDPFNFTQAFGDVKSSIWRLEYFGMGTEGDSAEPFLAPSLSVNGSPLRCRPDMVYRHRHANHVVIVEVKTTDHPLPRSLWPNVWAQLWVYSKISGIADASHVVVLAEVWGQFVDQLFLRRLVPRNPRREAFDAYFSQLFEIYRQHRERH